MFATGGACLCGLTTGSARCGRATCFGAWTVMLGSWLVGPVAVCEAAVPLRPHNNAVDRIATAEGATRLDDILTTRSPKSGPGADTVPNIQPAVPFGRASCSGAVTRIFHARGSSFGRAEFSPQPIEYELLCKGRIVDMAGRCRELRRPLFIP